MFIKHLLHTQPFGNAEGLKDSQADIEVEREPALMTQVQVMAHSLTEGQRNQSERREGGYARGATLTDRAGLARGLFPFPPCQ